MSKARARATVFSQLREFKTVVRGIVDRAAIDEDYRKALKPYQVSHQRFLNLGIAGRHASISCSIDVDKDVQELLEYNLIKLGHLMSDKKVQGKIELKPNRPNYRGRAGWDSDLRVTKGLSYDYCEQGKCTNSCKRLLQPVCFICPKCKASTLSSNPAFQIEDLDKVCKCASCKCNVKSNEWLCGCGSKWHTCDIHRNIQPQPSKKPPGSEPAARAKRPMGPLTQEQLQEIDTKRMRRAGHQMIPLSSNILSVKLRERFAHLL